MNLDDRIQAYVQRTRIAISGAEGSKRTMEVARTLYDGFQLSEPDTLRWLTRFSERCQPPWSEKELVHKVKSVVNTPGKHERGWMLKPSYANNGHSDKPPRPSIQADFVQAMETFLHGFRCTEADLFDASPVKPAEDFHHDPLLILYHLFRPGEGVNVVTEFNLNTRASGLVKADPANSGITLERDLALKTWKATGPPSSDAGGWLRINPVKDGIDDDHVTDMRHLLVEYDKMPLDLQICFFARFNAPICAILTSGGASIHAWLKVNCSTLDQYTALFLSIQQRLARFGMDTSNKNPSRLSRLTGVVRKIAATGDGRQRLLYLNPDPKPQPILS